MTVVVAEWLRRWTRNPLGSPRAGSNPADYTRSFTAPFHIVNDEEDEGRTSKKEDNILYRTNLRNYHVFFMASKLHLIKIWSLALRTCKRSTCPRIGIFFTTAASYASRKNVSHTSCRRNKKFCHDLTSTLNEYIVISCSYSFHCTGEHISKIFRLVSLRKWFNFSIY